MPNNPNNKIIIRGARTHNLQNINIEIPRNKFVVITGLSGSGKSSLAFDTIYAEGQRRYIESLSSYARQFLGVMNKPDVDQITGLSPAVSIDQRSVGNNPRSTVGTITEIYDYLRLLFAKIGKVHCSRCGAEVSRQSSEQIINKIIQLPLGTEIMIMAALVKNQKGEHKRVLQEIEKAGFRWVKIDGSVYTLEEAVEVKLDKNKDHTIEVIIDKLIINKDKNGQLVNKEKLERAVQEALELGDDSLTIGRLDTEEEVVFSQNLYCANCDLNLPEIEPRSFSFNNPHGACAVCSGLGTKLEIDPKLLIPNKKLSLAEGAIRPWSKIFANQIWYWQVLDKVALAHNFSTKEPVSSLNPKALAIILYGDKEGKIDFEGVIPILEKKYRETNSDYIRKEIENYMRESVCPACQGKRLKPESLAVTVGGLSIAEIVSLDINKTLELFKELISHSHKIAKEKLSVKEKTIIKQLVDEVRKRLQYLLDVGLGYLTLERSASTLAGGEAQRIRLATQIGSLLTGVTYILDEPSIGLHQRDNEKLIKTLKELRDLDNSVIVVEHDEATIMAADQVIDIGPGAGKYGGKIIAQGTPAEIKKNKNSLTGLYLAGKMEIAAPKEYRPGSGEKLEVIGATAFNLKNINVKIPLGKFVCLTGVSGSGKSTLVLNILGRALSQKLHRAKEEPAEHKEIKGVDRIDKVITIDQSPIGRTPRSNPATYTGVFTPIRELFVSLPESRIRNYKEGDFSFNVKGGRCEACQGEGLVKIEMQFLSDVYVLCEECQGQRYNKEVLKVHYNGKNIADVLAMTVEEASLFFKEIPAIYDKLKILYDVGLGYIKLGQSATTLSGGEAQRVKLATELSRRATGRTLYILDEPTTGLHFEDVKRLLQVLNRLVDKGNTILVIEHNLDVIKSADWLIDLGPEGGSAGGEIVAEGTPREVAKVKRSYTGQYLRKILDKK